MLVNWRRPSDALLAAARDGFDLVLAADILYEDRDVKPLIRLVERMLAPEGEVWLAEPGRDPAQQFIEALEERGWSVDSEACDCPWLDPHEREPSQVTVHRLRRPMFTPARARGRNAHPGRHIA